MSEITILLYVFLALFTLLGACIFAFVHGLGFSWLLKRPKPQFGSRFSIQVISCAIDSVAILALYHILPAPLSVGSLMFQVSIYSALSIVVYIFVTTKLTQRKFTLSFSDAAKSLRLAHLVYLSIILAVTIFMMVALSKGL